MRTIALAISLAALAALVVTRSPAPAAAQTACTIVLPVDVLPAPGLLARRGASLDDTDPAWRALGAERDRAPPLLA